MNPRPLLTVTTLLVAAICCWGITKADSIDVLIKKEKTLPAKVALLNMNARACLNTDPGKTLEYNTRALELLNEAKTSVRDSVYLESLFTLGLYYSRVQVNDSIIYIQGKVYNTAKGEGYLKLAARAINERGISFESLGNYKQALSDYLAALKLYEEVNDRKGIMHELMNIGLIYQYQEKYSHALSLYQRAIEIAKAERDEEGAIGIYNNLAIVYQEQKKFSEALVYFTKVLDFDLRAGDSAHIADSYNNIGVTRQGLRQYNKALEYYLASLRIKQSLGDHEGYANTCNNIASVYLDQGAPQTLEWLKKASEIGVKYKLNAIMLENYRIARTYYANRGDYKPALMYADLYYALQDSMKLNELALQTENMQKQYDLEKNAKELAIKDAEIARREYIEWIYLFVALTIAIAAIYLYYSVRKVKAMNRELKLHKEEITKINSTLVQKNIEAEKARHEAEEAVRAKVQFLSVMSHEIKTPLNAIIGITNLLEQGHPRPDQEENIEVLQRSSKNLLTLLNDILDYNAIEAGKKKAERVDFDLKRMILQLHGLFLEKANLKGIKLVLEYDERIPATVSGDSFHLNQVLMNLMSNAVKFTRKGAVTLGVELRSSVENKYTIGFKISDTGIGIPQHQLNTIFNPFMQADSKTTREFGGTGLGLAISKKLLSMSDTSLHVKSQVDKGSEFSFDLTLNRAEISDTNELSIPASKETINDLQGRRILVVEDNAVNVFVIRQFLTKWKAIVTIAENGEQAVDEYRKQRFDAILMDLHMPVMDGFEASRQILLINPSVKIIAITATHEEEVESMIKAAGMLDLVSKPFKPDDLFAKIKAVLS